MSEVLGPLHVCEVNDYEHDLVTKNSTALWPSWRFRVWGSGVEGLRFR